MIPWFDASQIQIAGRSLPTQGPLAIAGIAIGHVTLGRWLQRHQGLTPLRTDMMGFTLLAAAVITGHVTAVLVTNADVPFWQLSAPQSSLGALLGGAIVGALYMRRWRLDVPVVLDGAAWAFLHGWPLVRLGCVLAHDHPGRRSTLPIAVDFPQGPRLDIGLLEWLLCLGMLAFAHVLIRRGPGVGRIAAWATLQFAIGRLVLEWLRVDDIAELAQSGNLAAVALCLTGIGIGVVLWITSRLAPTDLLTDPL